MKFLIVIAMLALVGCATVGERVLQAGTTGAVRFSPTDVDKAIEIAVQAKDTDAEACFRAIRKHVDQEFKIETVGPVSAYAAARVRIHEARAGLAPDVRKECSVLILDAATFARQLGLTFSGALVP